MQRQKQKRNLFPLIFRLVTITIAINPLSSSVSLFSHLAMTTGCSRNALERQELAMKLFTEVTRIFEESDIYPSLEPGDTHTLGGFLTPDIHLTGKCWTNFRKWIYEEHEGWSAKRCEATAEDIKKYGAHNKRKSYFVDITFISGGPSKKKPKKEMETSEAKTPESVDDVVPSSQFEEQDQVHVDLQESFGISENDEDSIFHDGEKIAFDFDEHNELYNGENGELPMVYQKKTNASSLLYNSVSPLQDLPEQLQLHVLFFLNVPELGALDRTSKQMGSLAKRNEVWATHLKFFLEEIFDDVFIRDESNITPISKRENWFKSTEFITWYSEYTKGFEAEENYHSIIGLSIADSIGDSLMKTDDYQLAWLYKDVTFRDYYKGLGTLISQGVQTLSRVLICADCNEFDCICLPKTRHLAIFENLPRIRLFCD